MNKRDKKRLNEKVDSRQISTEEKRNSLDEFKDQQFVDDIPLEDLKIENEQETNKKKSQSTSQSEKKHKTGFGNKSEQWQALFAFLKYPLFKCLDLC